MSYCSNVSFPNDNSIQINYFELVSTTIFTASLTRMVRYISYGRTKNFHFNTLCVYFVNLCPLSVDCC